MFLRLPLDFVSRLCSGFAALADHIHLNEAKTSGPEIRVRNCVIENYFSYFSTKTYVVGAQKNRLDETVLSSTLNKCLNG